MHEVMNHPEVIVVGHGDIKVLHSFRSGTTFGDGSINLEFSFHEGSVFDLDFANNIWGMNALFISLPVNWSHSFSAGGGPVEIIKDTLKLSVLLSRFIVIGGSLKSVKPFVSELVYSI